VQVRLFGTELQKPSNPALLIIAIDQHPDARRLFEEGRPVPRRIPLGDPAVPPGESLLQRLPSTCFQDEKA